MVPLREWTCDACGERISPPIGGVVAWRTLLGKKQDFRILHGQCRKPGKGKSRPLINFSLDRAIPQWLVLAALWRLPGYLRFLLHATFLLLALSTACAKRTDVEVELREWGVNVSPSVVKPVDCINLNITNTGNLPHEFVVVESTPYDPSREGGSGPVIPAFEAEELPVENGRVRYYTHMGEPRLYFYTGGGWSIGGGQGESTPEIDPADDPGVFVAPGQVASFRTLCVKEKWPRGTTFIVFSNQPGDYERGMNTTLRVE